MSSKIRMRWLLLVLLGLAFAVTQDRFLMRRLLHHGPTNGTVHWLSSLDEATAKARREKKPIFVEFSATWCGPCQDMQQTTYRDPDVANILNTRFVPVLIDIDQQKDVAARFGVSPIPDEMFLAADGRELLRTAGYNDADEFLGLTDQALQAAAKLPPAPPNFGKGLSSGEMPTPALPPLPLGFP